MIHRGEFTPTGHWAVYRGGRVLWRITLQVLQSHAPAMIQRAVKSLASASHADPGSKRRRWMRPREECSPKASMAMKVARSAGR